MVSRGWQWWEEWQLRVLVLTSVSLQYLLFFAGILRKRCIPSWLRFLIWLAYLSSDTVAIYALATLFNRHKMIEGMLVYRQTDPGNWLEALWASILLIHLGGQDGITGYNIEDNELWRRHVLTAVSQVAVAVYVFQKSWPEETQKVSPEETINLTTGALMLVAGILKCLLKPWDLKRASINSLIESSRSEEDGSLSSFQENYVRDATRYFQEGHEFLLDSPEDDEVWKPYDLFVDLMPHHLIRVRRLKAFVHDTADKAHRLVRYGLSVTFDRIYTKEPKVSQMNRNKALVWISLVWFLLVTAGAFLSVAVVYLANARVVNLPSDHDTDVKVISILILLTVFLEFILPAAMHDHVVSTRKTRRTDGRWPDEVAQYNLIGYLARNKKHRKLKRLATMLVCKDYLDQLWCMKPSKSSSDITKLVHGYIAKGWTEHHIKDMATYREFNDNRGHWTLKREGCGHDLDWSLERPFDESVLLWHLATDFCFHLTATPPSNEIARLCRVMSNYMLYLLFVNPEMLMTGARRFLFREAYRQLKKTLKLTPQQPDPDAAGPSRHESELARKIAQNIQDSSGHQFRFIYDAWRLSQHLQNLRVEQEQDNAKMWGVVQGVWVEMLCFSAGRCSGYLHAKSLGKGGEYLSYIWLLMSYMGMETLAERMQRTKLKEEDATNNGGSSDATTTAASSSSIATSGSANGMTAAVPAAASGHRDGTTEASTSTAVTEGGDADGDGTIQASPVTTTDPGGDGRTAASPVTPCGDENV